LLPNPTTSLNSATNNLPDLKSTSDDAIPNYLGSLKFRQSHVLGDVHIALGWSAFAIAAACFYWERTFGEVATKPYTLIAVIAYAVITSAHTLWSWFVEKAVVYEGTSPSGEKVCMFRSKNHPLRNMELP